MTRSRGRAVLLAVLPAAALAAGAACAAEGGGSPGSVGTPAPAYSAVTPAGASVRLADERGRVVLLNVWATWCQPCRREMPALDTLHRRHAARGLRVVGVSVDAVGSAGEVEAFARELGASYPIWLDPDDRVSRAFAAYGVPTTVLVDREGVVRWRHLGAVTTTDTALAQAMDAALADTAQRPSQ